MIGIPETLGYSVLGICTVFLMLVILMVLITFMSSFFKGKKAAAAPAAEAPKAAAPAPAAPKADPAPGTAGNVDLHNVEPKTAAMIMAIVADEMGAPLNELRFISIKEI